MARLRLLIATRSQGKVPEITAMLRDLPLDLVTLNAMPSIPQDYTVDEPAMTFEGNAIIKAMTFGQKSGMVTLADDAGLEVDALGGQPGVHTARYAPGTDVDRYSKLLHALQAVPEAQRTARFRAVIAIYNPDTDTIRTCEGVFEGTILRQPRGSDGFGYDPVFYHAALGKTSAEMTLAEKNAVSHRGRALVQARTLLCDVFMPEIAG
jgi:XTP/dITP diphosphohydrolase